ncbi:MAG: DUF5131 family protein, partial [Blastopirellula sp. JB062]
MGEATKIEWCDHTFNAWRGCEKVAEGCKNCYAASWARRNPALFGVWGSQGTRVVAGEKAWQDPERWNRRAMIWAAHVYHCKLTGAKSPIIEWERQCGRLPDPELMRRPRIFVNSLADVFEDWRGLMANNTGQILTYDSRSPDWGPALNDEYSHGEHDETPVTMDDVRRRLFTLIDSTPY